MLTCNPRPPAGATKKIKQRAPDAPADTVDNKLTAYIHEVVASAPPLSAEQRDRLALLLRGAS